MTGKSPHSRPGIDPRAYRDTIGLFATGVTVITTRLGDVVHGMTANAVTSVSLDPTLLLICIDRHARMHELIAQAGVFAVNILAAEQEELSRHFAGRAKEGHPPEKLRFAPERENGTVPTIEGCVATISCTVETIHEGGDHSILVGRISDLRTGRPGTEPLLFFGGRYRRLAEADSPASPAPDLWNNDAVHVYFHEWEDLPDPEGYPFD